MTTGKKVGFWAGPLLFVIILALPPPGGLEPAGWRTAAVAVLMAVYWITEAIPISATALLPLVLLPSLGILNVAAAAEPYSNELIFLQMGGFLLAVTMERWGLHRRMALAVVSRVGTGPHRLVLGFMLASAFLSMWISNTATTAMMLPIAMAVATLFRVQDQEGPYELGICLMLGIAYSSSIGGTATLIGTPPNALLAATANQMLGVQIGFLEWMVVALPISLVFLPLGWLLLTRFLFRPGQLRGDAAELLAQQRARLGRMSWAEQVVAVVFLLAAFCWVMRSPKDLGFVLVPGIQTWIPALRDSTIAIAAAIILFLTPVDWKEGKFALDWETAARIPWGVLVLFGGGLSLAKAMSESGLASWIGSGVSSLDFLPHWLLLAAVATLFVFLTEVTSNIATTSMAMPVMVGAAVGLQMEPLSLMSVAALSASMAFMLPVATPPNAIVFASGYLTIPQMARAGFVFNLVSVVLLTLVGLLLVPFLLG